jgi:hypothetical protein
LPALTARSSGWVLAPILRSTLRNVPVGSRGHTFWGFRPPLRSVPPVVIEGVMPPGTTPDPARESRPGCAKYLTRARHLRSSWDRVPRLRTAPAHSASAKKLAKAPPHSAPLHPDRAGWLFEKACHLQACPASVQTRVHVCGGGRGIRTPGTRKGSTVFKTAALNHSAIPPFTILTDFSFPASPP